MIDIEIPLQKDKKPRYRFFEILPGALSWTILALPLVLAFISPLFLVWGIIIYLLIWFVKAVATNIRVLHGWHTLHQNQRLNWPKMLGELERGSIAPTAHRPKWHYKNLERLQQNPVPVKAQDIVHAIIIATYNESEDVLRPTFESIINSHYDMKKLIVILAYEERGGADIAAQSKRLINEYAHHFMHAEAIEHPADIPGEVIGKGGNITHAGRKLAEYVTEHKIDPMNVMVTTLDSDNRPHPNYLAALSYTFALSPDPLHTSYQPIALYTQNIWDVPAPMRVIATGNSFFQVVASMRLHALRNFSAHAQGLAALIDTDFWSVRTIVEDGHQFWRTYFKFDGKHEVYPIFTPVYQDAVFASSYKRTLVAQFVQLRRWAWGCSDIAYVAEMGFFRKNKINKFDLIAKFWRLFEGHISWATASLLILGAAFIPALINPNSFAATQLPLLASRIQTVALFGIVITFFLSVLTLPPKPTRYKRRRTFWMVLQWVYLPLTTIIYNGFSGLYSQTRLMLGLYMGKFDVTEKNVAHDGDKKSKRGFLFWKKS